MDQPTNQPTNQPPKWAREFISADNDWIKKKILCEETHDY